MAPKQAALDETFLIPHLHPTPGSEEMLEDFLRKKISSGEYPEGLRLPSTLPWAKALKIGDRRVQRVLSRLTAQGLLERRPRYGTYVRKRVDEPTVVILTGFPLVVEHVHHLRKIVELLIGKLRQLHYRTEVIDDLFSLLINDFDEQQRLVAKLKERLTQINPAGYVECAFDLSRLPDLYPLLERPLVSLHPATSGGDVSIDEQAFVRESLKYLASKGRRKVLLIRSAGRLGPLHRATATFWKSVEEFGFIRGMFREIYHSAITDPMEEEAYRWTLQLVESWKVLRRNYVPDCLVVCDDIMMRGIARAFAQSKIRVPEDLLIISNANESIRFHYGVPVVRCEVPLKDVTHHLAELLDARIGKRKPPKTPIVITATRIVEPTPGGL